MHKLLTRQIKRHGLIVDELSPKCGDFLQAVDAAYRQADEDRLLIERSLELTSQELLERNQQLWAKLELIERTRQQLTRAQRVAHIGSWDWDAATGRFTWSEELPKVLGLPPDALKRGPAHVLRQVPRPWRRTLLAALRQLRRNGVPINLEHDITTAAGDRRIIRFQAEEMKDDAGQTQGFLGTMQDVTEIKASHNKLKLAAAVFENSIEGVMVTDTAGMIQMVNPAFENITGYGADEVIGQSSALLGSKQHSPEAYAAMLQALEETAGWHGEITNCRKNGDIFPASQSIAALRDEQQRVTHFVTVFHDISNLKHQEALIRYQAYHDSLTELPNRMLLNDRLMHAIELAERTNRGLAVLFIDLDSFKYVNDSLGHAVGDRLLKETAQRIRCCLRKVDTVARLGGDEFVVVLENTDDQSAACTVAETLLSTLRQPFRLDNHDLFVTGSIGVTFFPEDGVTAEQLIRNADMAMYLAKEEGRNTFKMFTAHLQKLAVRRITLQSELRNALAQEEFVLHYQPKVHTRTGKLAGFEALVRWQHPTLGLTSPAEFIPIAEETGLIVSLGAWVLRTACEQLKQWRHAGHVDLTMAVNLSPRQFQDDALAEHIKSIIEETGIAPHLLELEITESMLMQNVEENILTMESLAEMGIKLSIDDFGTGYSSLSYLKRFPLYYLKIDKSFVHDITDSRDDAGIASSIIALGHNLGLEVVAEGVENREALEFLRNQGCDVVQGYYFSKPLPGDACGELICGWEEGLQ